MDTMSSSRRVLKPAQKQEVAEDSDSPETRERAPVTFGKDFGTKKQESEGRRARARLKLLLVKDTELLYSELV